jgi:hypothetical protein
LAWAILKENLLAITQTVLTHVFLYLLNSSEYYKKSSPQNDVAITGVK